MSDSLTNYIRKRKIANKSTWTSVVVNFFLVIFQIVVGFFSKSSGLIADGFHTLADMLSDLIVLITSKKSLNPPDDDHNYGHHRYENAAGLFLGVLLLFVGCATIKDDAASERACQALAISRLDLALFAIFKR